MSMRLLPRCHFFLHPPEGALAPSVKKETAGDLGAKKEVWGHAPFVLQGITLFG